MLKHCQFEDTERNEIKSKISKCQHIGVNGNEKRQCLNKYKRKDEEENIGYVLFSFIVFLLPLQKESNHLKDINKGTISLYYLMCIPKIGLLYN